jgi:ribosome biogenesis GTPase A
MPSQTIQWFPGHMAKTRRLITDNLPSVDMIIELLDARIPRSSQNPEINLLVGAKPVLTILNKASLSDPEVTSDWKKEFNRIGRQCIFTDCISGYGIKEIKNAANNILSDKIYKNQTRGMTGRALKAMVVGIPNVGKSTFINTLAGGKKAKAEDRPGITLTKQWVSTSAGIDLLDMPGVLWPKFKDQTIGENLALTGAIKDTVLDTEHIAIILCRRLRKLYPQLLKTRYKLESEPDFAELQDRELFELIGRKRGFLISGGEVNYERTAAILLDEFRGGKIGKITLERP